MKKHLWQIVVAAVIVALAIPITWYVMSNRESSSTTLPSYTSPADTSPTSSNDDQQEVPINPLAEMVVELRNKFPDYMIGENGYILVGMLVRDVDTMGGWYYLGIDVYNGSSSFIYTSPLYVTIIDDQGGAHQYEASSYSRYGSDAFTGIDLPPQTSTTKFFTFKITPPAKPKTVIYRDGRTPVITMNWVQP